MMTKKNYLLILATLCVVCGCGNKSSRDASRVVKVRVEQVGASQSNINRSYVGTVGEGSGSSLSFSTMGTVRSVAVQEGQSVKAGQVLATLDATQMQNAVQVADAALKQAEDAYKRMEMLYQKGSLPEIKFIDVKTKLSEAQTTKRMAQKNLSDCVLKAPFSGVIAKRSVDVGTNAMPGLECFKLIKLGNVEVTFAVPEQEIGSFKVGQDIAFTVAALDGKRYVGRVTKKGVEANALSHTYDVVLSVGNADRALLPGMVCAIEWHGKNKSVGDGHGVIELPQEAVLTDGDGQFVWIVQGSKATRRRVVVGDFTPSGVLVTDGLGAGEQVIVSGQAKVSEGEKVEIIKEK